MPEVCVERAKLITGYCLDHGLFKKDRISVLDKARMYRFVLQKRTPVVRHSEGYESAGQGKPMHAFTFAEDQLFAGSTTSKFKGVPLYPEFLALTLWPELRTLPTRARNPYQLTDADAETLNFKIFPHWMECNILEIARKRCKDNPAASAALDLSERLVFFLPSKANCISHTLPDFSQVVRRGLRAVIQEAQQRRQSPNADASQKDFYAAVEEALEGVIEYSRRLGAEAKRLAATETDPVAKRELLDLASIHSHVPEHPARSFREGLTTVWLAWVAIHLENANVGLSLGRLDQLLYNLYCQDLDAGRLTIEEAVELLCCLWLKIGDHVPTIADAGEQLFGGTGSNQAITLGGMDAAGQDAVNDLTYAMLRATELLMLRDPNLNARYCSGVNSPNYFRRLAEVVLNTGATPALHNDHAVIKALMAKGDSLEHARDYGIIGCVEPGSDGRSYGSTGALLLNLTSALELALFDGKHRHTGVTPEDPLISVATGKAASFLTFKDFKQAFATQACWLVEQAVTLNNLLGKVHQEFQPTPILSSFFEGPMIKGKDLIEGGAVINSSGAAIIGLADVADSLSAIRRVVFEQELFSLSDLLRALQADYAGYDDLRERLANPDKVPKYGNEDPRSRDIVQWIVELLNNAFGARENYRGGWYRVGYWSMTNHAGFGRLMAATPNGRKAAENFASGITPVSGVTPVLTKVLNSVACLPCECMANGVALNLKYTPADGTREKMLDYFVADASGYFDQGGLEIQFNVTDRATFIDAVSHPEKYPDLLVRVSGYTAYFKDLNPQMQKEIVDRTEYRLSTGAIIPSAPFPLPAGRS
jgi:formate C-acetyltransferase